MKEKIIIKSLLLSSALLFTGTTVSLQTGTMTNENTVQASSETDESSFKPKRSVIKDSTQEPYNTVAKVYAPYRGGTAFIVDKDKALTNRHVVEKILKTQNKLKYAKIVLAENRINPGPKKTWVNIKLLTINLLQIMQM